MLRIIFTLFVAVLISKSNAKSLHPKVIDGQPASMGQFPWYVKLDTIYSDGYNRDGSLCGGSLIHPRWVLTAGHCVVNPAEPNKMRLIQIKVSLGTVRKNYTQQIAFGVKTIHHEKYNLAQSTANDIALIKLKKAVKLTGSISVIHLTARVPASHKNVIALGFGVTNPSRHVESFSLNFIDMLFLDQNECKKRSAANQVLHPGIICAIGDGLANVCAGDSGGPLVVKQGNQHHLVGVTSTVSDNQSCNPKYPAYFSSIVGFREWIRKHSGV